MAASSSHDQHQLSNKICAVTKVVPHFVEGKSEATETGISMNFCSSSGKKQGFTDVCLMLPEHTHTLDDDGSSPGICTKFQDGRATHKARHMPKLLMNRHE